MSCYIAFHIGEEELRVLFRTDTDADKVAAAKWLVLNYLCTTHTDITTGKWVLASTPQCASEPPAYNRSVIQSDAERKNPRRSDIPAATKKCCWAARHKSRNEDDSGFLLRARIRGAG
jgi:hypothetical protein